MSTLQVAEPVAVWTEKGIPVRLVWRGVRFLVTDTATPIRETTATEAMTHPLERLVGWRFQGESDGREVHIFDVMIGAGDQWQLTAFYD